jgi:hypothetical protein
MKTKKCSGRDVKAIGEDTQKFKAFVSTTEAQIAIATTF